MKFSEAVSAAKARASAWNEHRKEQAAIRRMEKQARQINDPHAHSRFWLLNVPAIATVTAAITEWYWALLFCIAATGHLDGNYETAFGTSESPRFLWNFAFSAHWPVLVGLICATAPIVMLSMIWLPVQFAMRGAGTWRRGSLIAVGLLANALVIVSGTVVMNYNRQDHVREAVVAEQTAAQGRTAIEARLAFEQEQLRLALANTNPYLNQAANVGAEEWERSYVAQARATNDPRLPMLERALGAARAADQRRANIERLTIERAQAAPEAATQANVTDNVGAELNWFAQRVEVWRPPFVALICTLIGIFGAWWTLAMLERINPRDVIRSGWAREDQRIEDKRAEAPVAAQPMTAPKEKMYDAATGEELIKRRATWAKKPKRKGVPERMEFTPEIEPDETGVPPERDGRDSELRNAARDGNGGAANEQDNAHHPQPSEVQADSNQDESYGRDADKDHDGQADVENPEQQPDLPELDLSDLDLPETLGEESVREDNESAEERGGNEAQPAAIDGAIVMPDDAIEHVAAEQERTEAEGGESNHDDLQELNEREEPETDPAKLIAPIAAE